MPGDWVLAQDESDPDAVPTIRQVEEVFENQAQVMVLGLGNRSIETTPEHPFWVRDKGWTVAGEIETGEELRSHDGQWIPFDSKQLTDSIVTVYNMRVAEDHTYFVGSPLWGFTVWAHNMCALNDEPKIKLSSHAKLRGSQGRPVSNVVNDVQRAGRGDVYMEGSKFVVRGSNKREHIISPDGVVLTSLIRNKAARQKRLIDGIIRIATDREIEALKNLIP